MRSRDNLKSYINFFQSCSPRSVLAFISRLQVIHPLYKQLLKHNVAKMSEALSQAQPYIQLEPTTPQILVITEQNQSPLAKLPTMLQIDIEGSLLIRSRRSLYSHQVQSRVTGLQSNSLHGNFRSTNYLTPSKINRGSDA